MKFIFLIIFITLSLSSSFAQKTTYTEVSSLILNNPNIDRRASVGVLTAINGENVYISDITFEYAFEIFQKMKNKSYIPFRYPEDGCYARAQEMSRLIEIEENITTGKVFIEGNLKVITKNSPNGYVTWWYHVAPVVLVKGSPYVIDPSIFQNPVPVNEWFNIQVQHDRGRKDKAYYTTRFHYTPYDASKEMNHYSKQNLEDAQRVMKEYLEIQNERLKSKSIPAQMP